LKELGHDPVKVERMTAHAAFGEIARALNKKKVDSVVRFGSKLLNQRNKEQVTT
jgi:hypothetical protein